MSPAKKGGQATAQPMRPRARLMLTIGLELISSETVALSELIKNAFDADAQFVLLRINGPVVDGVIPAGAGSIEVLDDGVGMSASTIADIWLVPATPHRRRKRQSDAGRRTLGEKGVGRFAAAKLAERLELVSRPSDSPEVLVALDWADFEAEDAYLDEIKVSWVERQPEAFDLGGRSDELWGAVVRDHLAGRRGSTLTIEPDSERGTYLRMDGTRVDWTRDLANSIRATLSRLVSPFGSSTGLHSDFTIVLEVPSQLGDISGVVEPPEELQRPHYLLEAEVSGAGAAVGELTLKGGARVPIDQVLVNNEGDAASEEDPLRCGGFSIRLRVWDRDAESLVEVGGGLTASSVRDILNEAAGISVYRDGFRVLPYGERGDDWLGLDLRRVQSPTRRLSNNQIVGYLSIGRDTNPELVDQTNREGVVEGPALADLRSAVRQLLVVLENARYKNRPRRETRKKGGLLDRIDLGELKSAIAEKLPRDRALATMVVDLQRDLDQRTEEVGEVLARYHRLATLGQLVDRIVHELSQPLLATRQAATLGLERVSAAAASGLDDRCRDVVDDLAERLVMVRDQTRAASDVLRRIEPFGGRRRGRPPSILLESAIADAVGLLQGEVDKVGASIVLPEGSTTVTVDGTELQEVMVNLLTNSLHWLRRVPKKRRRIEISAERNPDGSLSILVEDSGPGVPEEDQAHIFEPYFTTREGGVGLGLSIAGEIVEDFYGGTLELLPPGEMGGARFRVTLRRRVGQ